MVEDFTTYTQTGSILVGGVTVTADRITFTTANRRGDDKIIYKDYGAGYFVNFTHTFTLRVTSIIQQWYTDDDRLVVYSLYDEVGTWYDVDAQNAGLSILINGDDGYSSDYGLLLCADGNWIDWWDAALSYNTDYYITIKKIENQAYFYVHTDAARTNLLTSYHLELDDIYSYRYIYPFQSIDDTSGDKYTSGYIEDLELYDTYGETASYRDLGDIEDETWGGIMVIDPNSLRDNQPGPHYYLLDTLNARPGLTDRSGQFTATINDNRNDNRDYDMALFHPGIRQELIRDNDEYWIGVQEDSGPISDLGLTVHTVQGTTFQPSKSGTNYTTIPEMYKQVTLSAGDRIIAIFEADLVRSQQSTADYVVCAGSQYISIEGRISTQYNVMSTEYSNARPLTGYYEATQDETISINVKWKSTGTVTAIGTRRVLRILHFTDDRVEIERVSATDTVGAPDTVDAPIPNMSISMDCRAGDTVWSIFEGNFYVNSLNWIRFLTLRNGVNVLNYNSRYGLQSLITTSGRNNLMGITTMDQITSDGVNTYRVDFRKSGGTGRVIERQLILIRFPFELGFGDCVVNLDAAESIAINVTNAWSELTDFSHDVTLQEGDRLVLSFNGNIAVSPLSWARFRILVDGVSVIDDYQTTSIEYNLWSSTYRRHFVMTGVFEAPSTGTYSVTLEWVGKSNGCATIYNYEAHFSSIALPTAGNGLINTWTPEDGGRYWIMGGWITRRHWTQPSREVIANIEGTDYTTLWRSQPIGTDTRPRIYSEENPIDLAQLAVTILQDVNDLQDTNYKFTPHSEYFPKYANLTTSIYSGANFFVDADEVANLSTGQAALWDDNGYEIVTISSIVSNQIFLDDNIENPSGEGYHTATNAKLMMASEFTGYTWLREIRTVDAFSLMSQICAQCGYEWQIRLDPDGETADERRKVLFYPRGTGAPEEPPRLRFDTNIRECPAIQTGDITELVTDMITLNGEAETVPPKTYMWMVPWFWQDIYSMSRKYSVTSSPLPPNSSPYSGYGRYGDATLVFDQNGEPALNFQAAGNGFFMVSTPYYSDDNQHPASALDLGLDLRKWRRLKFNFRHATRTTAGLTYYKIWLCTHAHIQAWADPNAPISQWYARAYTYEFGEGTQETSGDSDYDTVSDYNWTHIDLKLPTVDADGVVTDLNGWVENYPSPLYTPTEAMLTADPTSIDFMLIEINCTETEPGYAVVGGRTFLDAEPLTQDAAAGTHFIQIDVPEKHWARGIEFTDYTGGEIVFDHPKPVAYIGSSLEQVRVDAINGEYPDNCNVRLMQPLLNTHSSGVLLYLNGGYSWSISQLRFEKNTFVTYEKTSIPVHLQNPRRYRVSSNTAAETEEEAKNNAEHDLNILGTSRKNLQIIIDGDPRYIPGYLTDTALDPIRYVDGYSDLIFQYEKLMIDSASFIVLNTDFYIDLTLGEPDNRVFDYTVESVQAVQSDKLRKHIKPLTRERRTL